MFLELPVAAKVVPILLAGVMMLTGVQIGIDGNWMVYTPGDGNYNEVVYDHGTYYEVIQKITDKTAVHTSIWKNEPPNEIWEDAVFEGKITTNGKTKIEYTLFDKDACRKASYDNWLEKSGKISKIGARLHNGWVERIHDKESYNKVLNDLKEKARFKN